MSPYQIPIGNTEIMDKALQQARSVLEAQGGDAGVAFAEGIVEINGAWYAAAWCAVISNTNRIGFGGGLLTRLPKNLRSLILNGELSSTDLELFILGLGENPYQQLVQQAIIDIRNQGT